jgi:hypothetical protein
MDFDFTVHGQRTCNLSSQWSMGLAGHDSHRSSTAAMARRGAQCRGEEQQVHERACRSMVARQGAEGEGDGAEQEEEERDTHDEEEMQGQAESFYPLSCPPSNVACSTSVTSRQKW